MKRKFLYVLVLVLLVGILFTACKTGQNQGSGESGETGETIGEESTIGGELRVGSEEHNAIYNPLYVSSVDDNNICRLIYEGLVEVNEEGKTVENKKMVESLEISEDGLTYIFKIKPGIKFSTGEELTAKDVFFTYKVLADPSSTARNITTLEGLKNVKAYQDGKNTQFEGVEIIDDYTVAFNFDEKLRTNINSTYMKILSEKHYPDIEWGNVDAAMNAKMTEPAGVGPYVLEIYEAAQFVTLVKNEDYYAKDETDYQINRIVNKFIDTSLSVEELLSGEVDYVANIIDYTDVDRLKEAGMGTESYQRSAYGYLGFNNQEGYMADRAMRIAISYAVDRDSFVESQYKDLAIVPDILMPPTSSIYAEVKEKITHYSQDFEKALAVLEEAGYKKDGDFLKDKDGEEVSLKFLASSNNPVTEALIPMMSDDLLEIGIKLEATYVEFPTMLDIVRKEEADSWDMYFMASVWNSDEPDTWSSYTSDYIPAANSIRFDNAEFNKLILEGKKFLDLSDKEAIDHYAKAAIILNEEMPGLPIYSNKTSDGFSPNVKNLKASTYIPWSLALSGVVVE